MIHGVVLKDMVMERPVPWPVPAVAPELGAEGLLPYRNHAYREALSRNIDFFGDHGGGALVPRHDDALPERRRPRIHLGVGHTVQWVMCTRADYHGALWKESLREIFRMTSDGYCSASRPAAS